MILRKSIFISFSKLSNLITEEIIMFKKILSLAIVAMMLMSLIAVGASAAQVEVAEEAAAADDVASQGAEAEVAATGAGTIYFDAASAGWESASKILFYIYDLTNGSEFAAWGSSKKLGGTKGDNNIWSFDAEGLGVTAGNVYTIQFNNADTNAETYALLMDTSCFGDTAVADPGTLIENPVDSNKKSMEAHWTNNSLGSRLQITSIGNVVGKSIPSTTTAYDMLVYFLADKGKSGLMNALNFQTDKTAQQIIDSVAGTLNLTQADVTKAIKQAAEVGNADTGDKKDWSSDWDASKSSLPAGESGGSTSGDSSSKSSSGSSSTSTSSKSSTTTSTSSKSGSASNTQTGQEENILFIMLGVMVLAAGVIFFVRKKERA